ncbi:3-isopropylmalate dehydratase small subunit [candidate division KSB1 bacterium]|nr:3-isopropylmalate dehydratase small subunit [candidate division KSB1 bacterium]
MEPFKTLTSTFVSIPVNDIDTDQLIPARFLKVTDKAGLGDNLFYDWRYDQNGHPKPEFILNQPKAKSAKILVGGDNFGCGSSREHAPWALMGYGFRAVISTSFADIFRNNSLKNGLLPVIVDEDTLSELHELAERDPDATLKIDLSAQTLQLPGGKTVEFPIDTFSKTCMLQGIDQLGYLLKHESEIEKYEKNHPPRVNTKQAIV